MDILKKKIGFISLGCDKNRVDLEKMMFKISSAGFDITNDLNEANVIIINTCSFIEPARVESIDTILDVAGLKGNVLEKIVVTGCINEMQYTDLADSFPEVDAFVNIKDNDSIVRIIGDLYQKELSCNYSNLGRVLTTPKHYAYLKVSDGCDNFCSYCKIPYIRGRYKSESIANILEEAKILVANGAKEIILVAQDLTKYGTDFKDGTSLVTLIRKLSEINDLKWIRLLYCYPESLTDDLIAEIRDNPKVCKYLDIPLQHVESTILKFMNRRNNYEKIVSVINKLRSNIPDISIRSTFILGFPGEGEKEFNTLLDFVKEYKLNQVGFFEYSKEEGTRAYSFDNQVNKNTKKKRLKTISEQQYKVVTELNSSLVGQQFEVVVDGFEGEYALCRSQYLNPETDSIIYVKNDNLQIGQFYNVKITDFVDYDLEGEIL